MSAKERPVSHPATDAYRRGHDRIFGEGKTVNSPTPPACSWCGERHEGGPEHCACTHDAPRRGYYGSKCSACGQDFLARDIR